MSLQTRVHALSSSRNNDNNVSEVAKNTSIINNNNEVIGPGRQRRVGRWTKEEKLLFLYGLKEYGKGNWKKIGTFVQTRSLDQIKSHAQKLFKNEEKGKDIYWLLYENRNYLYDDLLPPVLEKIKLFKEMRGKNYLIITPTAASEDRVGSSTNTTTNSPSCSTVVYTVSDGSDSTTTTPSRSSPPFPSSSVSQAQQTPIGTSYHHQEQQSYQKKEEKEQLLWGRFLLPLPEPEYNNTDNSDINIIKHHQSQTSEY